MTAALENEQSGFADIARWYLAAPQDMPTYPGAKLTVRETADELISPDADHFQIERAFERWPLHPLVHLALARFEKNPVRAEFLRKYSLERLLPNTPAAGQAALRKRAATLLDKQPGQEQRAAELRK